MKIIGVIGGSVIDRAIYQKAYRLGKLIGEKGFGLITGGLGGVMEGVSKGAFEAGGIVIGVLPGNRKEEANPYVNIPIVTGIGEMRNVIIVKTADILIAVDGSYGTFTEIAFALKMGKKVIGMNMDFPLQGIEIVETPEEAMERVEEHLYGKG